MNEWNVVEVLEYGASWMILPTFYAIRVHRLYGVLRPDWMVDLTVEDSFVAILLASVCRVYAAAAVFLLGPVFPPPILRMTLALNMFAMTSM